MGDSCGSCMVGTGKAGAVESARFDSATSVSVVLALINGEDTVKYPAWESRGDNVGLTGLVLWNVSKGGSCSADVVNNGGL